MKKAAQDLLRLARTALERAGANSKMAEAAARHLVRADGAAQPAMVADRAAVCLIDNRDGGARRFAAEATSAGGIEVPDELLAQIEKLCST